MATIGGGVVTDPAPPFRRVRPFPIGAGDTAARLALMLEEAGGQGMDRASLPVRLGVSPSGAETLAADAVRRGAVAIGARLFDEGAVAALAARLATLLAAHHAASPLESGMSLQELRSQLAGAPELLDAVVKRAVADGVVETEGGTVRARGWTPRTSPEEERLRATLAATLREAGREPPSVGELVAAHGEQTLALLRLLERSGEVVAVESDRYYAREAVDALVEQLRRSAREGVEHSPAELRDLLGVSRKYLIPFLEFCDRSGVTRRRESGRVIVGARGGGFGVGT